MSSKNVAELRGKSLLEVLARMLVEHPCKHVLFCRVDASEHSGTMGLGLCTALQTCSAVHKINTLHNFSIALCTNYCSGKSRGKDILIMDYKPGQNILALPFISSQDILTSPSPKTTYFDPPMYQSVLPTIQLDHVMRTNTNE